MKTGNRVLLIVIAAAVLGAWGCSESRVGPRTAARIRHLETRNAKLEEDYQAAVDECLALRDKLTDALRQSERLQKFERKHAQQLQTVGKERDALKQQVADCAGQRDALQAQMVGLSKDLQSLAGRISQIAANREGAVTASAVSIHEEK